MDELLERLKSEGCDVDGSMDRFLNDKEFYISCFKEVLNDPAFKQLGEALDDKNTKEAFDAAHTLKGIILNLGITPLYEIIVHIVEPLRVGKYDGVDRYFKKLTEERDTLKKIFN
jgi:chemotaxis protein histidine kinase CheA